MTARVPATSNTPTATGATSSERDRGTAPASILVVDDHAANLLAVEVTLQPLGQRIVTASSGSEALVHAREEEFAAILLDVRMNGMDGMETALRLRQLPKNRRTPVLLLSAAGLEERELLRGYAHGAVDFLRKPFPPEVLRAKVAAFVDLYLRAQDLKGQEVELKRRERQAQLTADVGVALTRSDYASALQQCAQALVVHLDLAFARIWTYDAEQQMLELKASAGLYTHLDGPHARVPVGKFKIGLIAQEMRPHVTNDVQGDPRIGDQEWARREGMVAFAGHPLIVEQRLVGVLAAFARHPLTRDALAALGSVADAIALGVERERTERLRALSLAREKRRSEQLRGLADASLALHSAKDVETIHAIVTEKAKLLTGATEAAIELGGEVAPPDADGTRLSAPLIGRGGKTLGRLSIGQRAHGRFGADDESIVVQLAHLASVALDSARLLAQTQAAVRALERSNAELDQFAYVTSHDLKAPLRGIASLSQWLEDDLGGAATPEAREQLGMLRNRVKRMEGLINGILDYSRAGRSRLEPERVDVGKLASELIELLSPAPPARIEVVTELPTLCTERVPLQQVLLNLLSNALKHAKRADAHVRLGTEDSGEFYDFWVADNGPGIAPEFHQRIWGIFQTLEPRDVVEGTGIGLSVVKKVAEAQGGRAWVESEPGAGATFHVTWPKRHPGE